MFLSNHIGDALLQGEIISSYAVHSQLDCSFECLLEETCVAYNYRNTNERYFENCQLSSTRQEGDLRRYGDWTFYEDEEDMKVVGKNKLAIFKITKLGDSQGRWKHLLVREEDINFEGTLLYLEHIWEHCEADGETRYRTLNKNFLFQGF